MRRLGLGLALLLALFVPRGTWAQSTINTAQPVQGKAYNAAPIRDNFGAAANDINAILRMNSGASPPSAPVLGTQWLQTPNSGTTYTQKLWDPVAHAWVPVAALESTTGLWVPPVGGGTLPSLISAATTDLGSVPQAALYVTGAQSIASFGSSAPPGQLKFVIFTGAATLIYNSTFMILPGNTNFTAGANNTAIMLSLGQGKWRMISSGSGGGGSCDIFTATTSGCVPASGGGTVNFLRADGTWVPAGGSTLFTIASGFTNTVGTQNIGNQTIGNGDTLNEQFWPTAKLVSYVVNSDNGNTSDTGVFLIANAAGITFTAPNPSAATKGNTYQFGSDGTNGFTLTTVGGAATLYGCPGPGAGATSFTFDASDVQITDDGQNYKCTSAATVTPPTCGVGTLHTVMKFTGASSCGDSQITNAEPNIEARPGANGHFTVDITTAYGDGGMRFTTGSGFSGTDGGGNFNVLLGSGAVSGDGGTFNVTAGDAGATTGNGGAINLTSGGAVNGNAGEIKLLGADASNGNVGGRIRLLAGNGLTDGIGGAVIIAAGAGANTGNGGAFSADAGPADLTGVGGAATLTAGAGGATSGDGGALTITAGAATLGGGGTITINAGDTASGTGGALNMRAGDSDNGNAGGVSLAGGDATDFGAAGNVTITGGSVTSGGSAGYVALTGGTALTGSTTNGGGVSLVGGNADGAFQGGVIGLVGGVGGTGGDGGDVGITPGDAGSGTGSGGKLQMIMGQSSAGSGGYIYMEPKPTAGTQSAVPGDGDFQDGYTQIAFGHIVGGIGTSSPAAHGTLSACGGGTPAFETSGDNDTRGVITVGTGVVTACTLTFKRTWNAISFSAAYVAPKCFATNVGATPNAISVSARSITAVTFTFAADINTTGGAFQYWCVN